MVWQDIVLTVGAVIFILALIPAVRAVEKPPVSTSFLNAAVLVSFIITYASLSLWLAAIINSIIASMWFFIGIRKLKQKKKTSAKK